MRTHQQRMSRIQAARDPDNDPLDSRRLKPLHQTLDLDFVYFLASLIARARIGRDIRKALVGSLGKQASVLRQLGREKRIVPEFAELGMHRAHALTEAVLPRPFQRQPFEVDLGANQLRLIAETARFGEDAAVLADQGDGRPRRGR